MQQIFQLLGGIKTCGKFISYPTLAKYILTAKSLVWQIFPQSIWKLCKSLIEQ